MNDALKIKRVCKTIPMTEEYWEDLRRWRWYLAFAVRGYLDATP